MNIIQTLFKNFSDVSLGPVQVPQTDLTNSALQKNIQTALGIAAAIALLIIVISSFKMVISRGNAEAVAKARGAIIYATIGLVVMMSALGIVTFVVGRL